MRWWRPAWAPCNLQEDSRLQHAHTHPHMHMARMLLGVAWGGRGGAGLRVTREGMDAAVCMHMVQSGATSGWSRGLAERGQGSGQEYTFPLLAQLARPRMLREPCGSWF